MARLGQRGSYHDDLTSAVALFTIGGMSGTLRACPSETLKRMKSTGIDPRDAGWEIPNPRYRVNFHDSEGASDEYEVEGANVREVLALAEKMRGTRTFVLYACIARDGLGLGRLHGRDPNEPGSERRRL